MIGLWTCTDFIFWFHYQTNHKLNKKLRNQKRPYMSLQLCTIQTWYCALSQTLYTTGLECFQGRLQSPKRSKSNVPGASNFQHLNQTYWISVQEVLQLLLINTVYHLLIWLWRIRGKGRGVCLKERGSSLYDWGGGISRGLTIPIKIFNPIWKYFSYGFEKLWQKKLKH